MPFDPIPFDLRSALLHWCIVFGGALGVALVVAVLVSIAAYGVTGPLRVLRMLLRSRYELFYLSPRRIGALTLLTFKESYRRKTLLVFAIFALLFMFAGWFITDTSDRPELQVKVHVAFVLTTISYLILPVVLLLACWGLPEDIKARSLHTVVTKPARRSEIVLGRMLGVILIGTFITLVMAGVGYVWILRQIQGEAARELVSRVPIIASRLTFLDREGRPSKTGINVGYEWDFRGYIEGATKARAIWDFEDLHFGPETDSITLEWRFESFRTYKGDIDRGLFFRFHFINPETGFRAPTRPIQVFEYHTARDVTTLDVPRDFSYVDPTTGQTERVDLFEKAIADGRMQIEVECLDSQQFLGMARPDLFIRLPDRSFASGFFKAVFGIWLMTVLVILLGVSVSTFVKGPVATLFTFALLIVGQGFRATLETLVKPASELRYHRSGPLEAWYRLITQQSELTPLVPSPAVKVVVTLDEGIRRFLWLVQHVVPDFRAYGRVTDWVANGFDPSWNAALLPCLMTTLAYVLPCFLIGLYSMNLRELEAK